MLVVLAWAGPSYFILSTAPLAPTLAPGADSCPVRGQGTQEMVDRSWNVFEMEAKWLQKGSLGGSAGPLGAKPASGASPWGG